MWELIVLSKSPASRIAHGTDITIAHTYRYYPKGHILMDVTDIHYQVVLLLSSSYHYKFCENLTFEDNLNNTSIFYVLSVLYRNGTLILEQR